MKQSFISLLACILMVIPSVNAQNLELRIMSFNVQQPNSTNWDGRKANAALIIKNENPDVIGTQEAVNYQRDYLISNTTGYSWFGSGRDGGDAGEASWIFYKTNQYTLDAANSGNLWLSNTPTVPSRFGGSYNRICTYVRLVENSSGQGFYVFNVHNYMPSEYNYRLQAVKLLTQRISERSYTDDPVFFTGDFNSTEGDGVTLWMKSGTDNPVPCRDSYRDFDPSGSVTTGFGVKYDYIYYPDAPEYSTQSSWVVKTPAGASDHMPIVADVTVLTDPDAPSISLSQSTAIYEGSEDGKTITVLLNKDVFTGVLTSGNWTVANLPAGVSLGAVARVSDTVATLTLSGNSTQGTYTADIENVTVTVAAAELANHTGSLSKSAGVTLSKAPLAIPGKIQAEDYATMSGVQLETCTDTGGGKNAGYLDVSDYMTYQVNIAATGAYIVDIRIAAQSTAGQLQLLIDDNVVLTQTLSVTGGWQTWKTVSGNVDLTAGIHTLKLYVAASGFNLNWVEFTATSAPADPQLSGITATPANPKSTQDVVISAIITDDVGLSSAVVNWGTSAGVLSNQVAMTANGDTYSGTIPAQANGTNIYYAIVATDGDANTATSTEAGYTVRDNVTAEFQVKVMSFNLWRKEQFWSTRLTNSANLINTEMPDVVGIQEGDQGKCYDIEGRCPGYALETGPSNEESSSILYNGSTLSVIESDTIINDWGGDQWVRLCFWALFEHKSSGNRFYVYNNHWDPNYYNTRVNQAKHLARRISERDYPEYPFFLIGDLNPTQGGESEECITYLKTGAGNPAPMVDTYREIYPAGGGVTHGGSKLDYIFVANDNQHTTTEAEVIYHNTYGQTSDHYQIYAVVSFVSDPNAGTITLSQSQAIYEGAENGKTITVHLSNDTFTGSLTLGNWTASNLPAGVTLGSVARVNDTTATLTLNGNTTVGSYTGNITNVTVTVSATELVNSASSLSRNNGILLSVAPLSIPGKIEAEDYDTMSGVQLETCTDAGGGQDVGYLEAGDYMTYQVNVSATGTYDLGIRIASATTVGQLQLQIDGEAIATKVLVVTGGWQTWQTVSSNIDLTAGLHTLKLYVVASGFNINWIEFTATAAPADPVIGTASATPENPSSLQDVNISATITDDVSISLAVINWGTSSGNLSNQVTMDASGDVYSGIIPAQANGTVIYYALSATDGDDNTTTSATYSYSVSDNAKFHSWDAVMSSGTPQATITADNLTADLSFYESTDNDGVSQGANFTTYAAGTHPDGFNHLQTYWHNQSYPYVGMSTVARGDDSGEANAPSPSGVYDLQMHPPSNAHLTVCAFTVPRDGNYIVSGLAARRVSASGANASLKVFSDDKSLVAHLIATNNQDWVTDAADYDLGVMNMGQKIYFAVDNEGEYAYDATEIAWTVQADVITGTDRLDMTDHKINVYPNPAHTGVVHIQSDTKLQQIIVLDLQGRVVFSERTNGKSTSVSVSDLKQGVYFLKMHTSHDIFSRKLIIK